MMFVKEGQVMSSFGLICEMDGCVPGTEKDAPKPFERWKGLSWNKVFWKITNQPPKMLVQIKREQRTIGIFKLKFLIRILTACEEIILAAAFGFDSSCRNGRKFSYPLLMDFKDIQWWERFHLAQLWYRGVPVSFSSHNSCLQLGADFNINSRFVLSQVLIKMSFSN